MNSPVRVWTIGHSTRSFEQFLALLQAQAVRRVADVRRFPGSRRLPHFNQETLAAALSAAGIDYVHLPELGGRRRAQPNSANNVWRNEAFRGYADYMETAEFKQGITRLLQAAQEGPTAMMCSEALWWQCHRGLIADWLKAAGHEVIHILDRGKTEIHPFTSAARLVDGELSYRAPQTEPLFPSG